MNCTLGIKKENERKLRYVGVVSDNDFWEEGSELMTLFPSSFSIETLKSNQAIS